MRVSCPNCRAESVPAPNWSFTDTSVQVPVCESCQVDGLVAVTVKVSAMVELTEPTTMLRHRDGLVVF